MSELLEHAPGPRTPPPTGAAQERSAAPIRRPPSTGLRVPRRSVVVIVVVGMLLSGLLGWVVSLVSSNNEQELLQLQVSQAAAALQASLPSVQATLFDDYKAAVATKGSVSVFDSFSATALSAHTFTSLSLWRLGAPGGPVELAHIGAPLELVTQPDGPARLFGRGRSPLLGVTGFLAGAAPRLGYVEEPALPASDLVVYAENALPGTRAFKVPRSSPFSDLDFSLYLGRSPKPNALLESSTPMPSDTNRASAVVPFGNSSIEVVASPRHWLGGPLSRSLIWVVAAAGLIAMLAAALVAERLTKARARAEVREEQTEQLLVQQLDIAKVLQSALLPTRIADVPGLELAARYSSGADGLDIGGDFYDVIALDGGRCALVVGDVSGRGLEAGITMASLRFGARAYVAQGDPPGKVLDGLEELVSLERDGHFATVLCALADIDAHELSVANAGHLPMLIASGATATFVSGPVGAPVGIGQGRGHSSELVKVVPGASILMFTDGLVERRGETLDEGLERLRECWSSLVGQPLEDMLDAILDTLVPDGSADDIAMLGVRWQR